MRRGMLVLSAWPWARYMTARDENIGLRAYEAVLQEWLQGPSRCETPITATGSSGWARNDRP